MSELSWRQTNVILKSMKFIRSPHPPPDHLGCLLASRSLCVKRDSQEEVRATWAVVPDTRISGRPPVGQGEPRGARACFHASCGGRVMWDSPTSAAWMPSLGPPCHFQAELLAQGPLRPHPTPAGRRSRAGAPSPAASRATVSAGPGAAGCIKPSCAEPPRNDPAKAAGCLHRVAAPLGARGHPAGQLGDVKHPGGQRPCRCGLLVGPLGPRPCPPCPRPTAGTGLLGPRPTYPRPPYSDTGVWSQVEDANQLHVVLLFVA